MIPEVPPNSRAEQEARITAWLLGELSAEEAAQVREMIAKDPELDRLRHRLSQTLNLVRETLAAPMGETPALPARMKLSAARREKLLASFKTISPKEFERPRRKVSLFDVVACAAIIAILAALLLPTMSGGKSKGMRTLSSGHLTLKDVFRPSRAISGESKTGSPPPVALDETPRPSKPHSLTIISGSPAPDANHQQYRIVLPQSNDQALARLNPDGSIDATFSTGNTQINRNGTVSDSFNPTWNLALNERESVLQSREKLSDNKKKEPPAFVGMPRDGADRLAHNNAPKAGFDFAITTPPASAPAPVPQESQEDKFRREAALEKYRQLPTPEHLKDSKDIPTAGVTRYADASDISGTLKTLAAPEQPAPAMQAPPQASSVIQADLYTPIPAPVAPPASLAASTADVDYLTESSKFHRVEESHGAAAMGAARRLKSAGEENASRNSFTGRYQSSITPIPGMAAPAGPQATGTTPAQPPGGAVATATGNVTSVDLGLLTNGVSIEGAFENVTNGGIMAWRDGKQSGDIATSQKHVYEYDIGTADPAAVQAAMRKLFGSSVGTESQSAQSVTKDVGGTTWNLFAADKVDTTKAARVLEDAPLARQPLPALVPQPEVLTVTNPFTTFSLNVSDVAFNLAAASLQNGVMPDAASMRSEEFINAFDYRDPEPAPGAPIGFASERAGYPFAHNRDLLRFSIKTAAQGRQAGRPLNLVLLLDKSGSMERADRVEIIAHALRVLALQLHEQDTLSVVVFARTARLFVDGVPGSQAGEIAGKLRQLTPEGGTNLEEAMKLAREAALRHYLANGENRIVLLTDGAANLGNVDPATLKKQVESDAKQGLALDCFGVGWDGYNDDLLATLSRAGHGRYGFINTPQEADTEFAGKLAGALRVAAADVKVQVEFNPSRVKSYRQIGYAKDQLKKEEFRDNSVHAASIGAAESGNALYTIEINPAGDGPIGTVHVRFRIPGTQEYQEHEWTVPYTGTAVALENSSPAMRLAATASAFSEWLARSPYANEVTTDRLLAELRGVPEVYGADTRPKKLEWMIRQAGSISGK